MEKSTTHNLPTKLHNQGKTMRAELSGRIPLIWSFWSAGILILAGFTGISTALEPDEIFPLTRPVKHISFDTLVEGMPIMVGVYTQGNFVGPIPNPGDLTGPLPTDGITGPLPSIDDKDCIYPYDLSISTIVTDTDSERGASFETLVDDGVGSCIMVVQSLWDTQNILAIADDEMGSMHHGDANKFYRFSTWVDVGGIHQGSEVRTQGNDFTPAGTMVGTGDWCARNPFLYSPPTCDSHEAPFSLTTTGSYRQVWECTPWSFGCIFQVAWTRNMNVITSVSVQEAYECAVKIQLLSGSWPKVWSTNCKENLETEIICDPDIQGCPV